MLNKYIELHDQHMDLLVKYYNVHQEYIRKPTYERTAELRAVLSELRVVQKEMRMAVQEYRKHQEASRQQNREGNNTDEHN